MERINYAINDNLKYTDFNNYLQDMSVKSISLIDLLNKQLKINTIGTINNIDINSSNNFVQNFLNYSFIDFVTKFYLYPKSTADTNDTNLLMQGASLDRSTTGSNILNKYYWDYYSSYDKESYKNPNQKRTDPTLLFSYNSTEFNLGNASTLYHRNINNNTNIIGLRNDISGWDKEIKIPICQSVINGHINNAMEVTIKTPNPCRNIIYDGSADALKNGKTFNVSNLNGIGLVFYLSNYKNASFYYEKKDLERQYGISIHIYDIWFNLSYASGTIAVSYDDGWYSDYNSGKPANTRVVITANVAS